MVQRLEGQTLVVPPLGFNDKLAHTLKTHISHGPTIEPDRATNLFKKDCVQSHADTPLGWSLTFGTPALLSAGAWQRCPIGAPHALDVGNLFFGQGEPLTSDSLFLVLALQLGFQPVGVIRSDRMNDGQGE